ncbi:MAG: SPASM domain-containing protein [Spirochaetales bacterium]
MPRIYSLLIRPTGDESNVECAYTPDIPVGTVDAPAASATRMSSATLETAVAAYMGSEQPQYSFTWDGGEPTLMGVDFFRRAFELQRTYRQGRAPIANTVRTNATLIDDEMAELFAEHDVAVEILLDGPADLHDASHRFSSGEGSSAATLRGVETLRRHWVEHRLSVTVSRYNVANPKRLYRYFQGRGFRRQKYLPWVDIDPSGTPVNGSIDGSSWGAFLSGLFDTWSTDPDPPAIEGFEAIMRRASGGVPTMCSLGSTCRQRFVIEPNGDVFPCEVYVDRRLRLGNVATDHFDDMWMSETFRAFGASKRALPDECIGCAYKVYCRGDCPKHRIPGDRLPTDEALALENPPPSLLCEGWKQFFSHALSDLEIQAHERIDR